jgi:D-glycero-D-manno-heptose 1,7-bisphosphate phosphatase
MIRPEPQALSPAVFFDRDGTLMEEAHYCHQAKDVHAIPGAATALQKLKAAGFKLVVLTNQSGIGRGYFTEAEFHVVEAELQRQLGGVLDRTYFCPAAPEANDPRRKPSPAMAYEAAEDLGIDLSRSWMIGDRRIDLECGRRAGMRSILVMTGYGAAESQSASGEIVVKDVCEAAEYILTAQSHVER